MNEELWDRIRTKDEIQQTVSPWVRAVLLMPFSVVQELPALANDPSLENVFAPKMDFIDVTQSYLEFLKGQIALEPRGKDWAAVLAGRLAALTPYEGKTVGELTIRRMHAEHIEGCWILFDPDSLRIIHIE